jgi:hypothetical protein
LLLDQLGRFVNAVFAFSSLALSIDPDDDLAFMLRRREMAEGFTRLALRLLHVFLCGGGARVVGSSDVVRSGYHECSPDNGKISKQE